MNIYTLNISNCSGYYLVDYFKLSTDVILSLIDYHLKGNVQEYISVSYLKGSYSTIEIELKSSSYFDYSSINKTLENLFIYKLKNLIDKNSLLLYLYYGLCIYVHVYDIRYNRYLIKYKSYTGVLNEKIENYNYSRGDEIYVFINKVSNRSFGASHSTYKIIQYLLKKEIPNFTTLYKNVRIERHAGIRTKIVVYDNKNISHILGDNGSRINTVKNYINNELIDVIIYSPNLDTYIHNLLVLHNIEYSIELMHDCINVYVPHEYINRVIGNKGYNVILSTRLLRKKIRIVGEY